MATCKKCGKEIDEGVKFCSSCGTAVQQAAPKETTEKKPGYCAKCGKPVDGGVKFCPSCGTAVSGKPVKTGAQNQDVQQDDPSCLQADTLDAEQNKGMAVVAYILFFIPLITGDHKKSPFVMFHTNQGTVLFITSVAVSIVSAILTSILTAIFRQFHLGLIFLFIAPIRLLVGILLLVLFIIGIINAVQGRMKPLPLIGKFTIIK